MGVGSRLASLTAALLALALCGSAAAKISHEIFALKPNKFAEKSFFDRITPGPGLELDDKTISALKGVYPDNRLLPDELKKIPVIEISGADKFLKAYTAAKGWFATTMKIHVKVSRDRQNKPPFNVLRIGFAADPATLVSEELTRLDGTLGGFHEVLDQKLKLIEDKAKNIEDRIQGFQDDLRKEEQARVAGDKGIGGSAMIYTGAAGVLALIAILGLVLEAQKRKKQEELLKTQLDKGGEPANFLKL